ncbi:hypothetical protein GG344DRAFT_63062 [Lentinula edodes]|nr:hypothetical protein GG344DRAFT_63062 [Lentinula edodes]
MILLLKAALFPLFITSASHYSLGVVNVGASPIDSTVLHDHPPARLFLGYTYIREGKLAQRTRKDGSDRLLDRIAVIQPSMKDRVEFQKQFCELEIEIDEEAFSKFKYIFINDHVETRVEDEIRSHQMRRESTIVVQPQKDKLATTDTMKDLEFEAAPHFYDSLDGTLKFYVSSVTPVSCRLACMERRDFEFTFQVVVHVWQCVWYCEHGRAFLQFLETLGEE